MPIEQDSLELGKGVVEMTDSLAADLTHSVDSLAHFKPHEFLEMLSGKGLANIEGVADQLLNNFTTFAVNLIISIIVFMVGRWIIGKINYIIEVAVIKRRVERSVRSFLRGAIGVLLYTLLLLVIVQILGINTTSLVAMLASAGLAVGMALSGTLQNFAGGVMILFLKPYKVGDYITTQDDSGTVIDIMLFTTVLETYNRHTIFVPNSSILSSTIKNATYAENRRLEWSVGITYGDSVDKAREVIFEILNNDERILRDNTDQRKLNPMVGIVELGSSSVNLTVKAWVETRHYWDVYFDIYEQLYKTLPHKGIRFPVPQLDLHIKNEEGENFPNETDLTKSIK